MPTLTSTEPDTINLDFFYTKYPSSFGVAFLEESSTIPHPIPAKTTPLACITKILRSDNKVTHFIKAPPTTATAFCLCNKYHTKFITTSNKPFKPVHTDFIPFVANTKNKNTQKMLQSIATSTDNIPPSPTPVTHQHSCQKCQQLISCKVTNN